MTLSRLLLFLILAGLLVACAALDSLPAPPTPVSTTEPPSPSATFAWFPPSPTPTPQVFSTHIPTPEMRPGLGTILLTDDFSDASVWNTAVSDQASAGVDRNRLTLAVQAGVYMISLRQDLILGNYYVEITARPSLCRGEDDYGLLVRASAAAYYRFALSCNGTAHVERVSVGTRHILHEPVASGDVPPGAPGEVRIGVWAVETEMRLFLNGRYQFSVTDANYASGTIGFFANSAGDTPVTVTFTDLTVRSVTYVPPTRTPVATP